MMPTIFKIGDAYIPSFFFMIMVGSLVATYIFYKIVEKEGLSVIVALDMAIIAVVMSIVGARLFHVAVEAPAYYWEDPIRIFYFWQGGFVSLGAFLASIGSWILYLKWRRQPIIPYFDLVSMPAAIVVLFVRIGCLMAGCCYGKPTHSFLHIIFHNPASTAGSLHPGVPLHPTQIYFMINAVVMFTILWTIYRSRRFFTGMLVSVFLMYYGVSRFFIEFLRGDDDRGVYFNGAISTGQIVMIGFFTAGLVVYLIGRRAGRAHHDR